MLTTNRRAIRFVLVNMQMPKVLFLIFLAMIVATSACNGAAPTPSNTGTATPQLATAIAETTVPEPAPSALQSPTVAATVVATHPIPVPSGLQIVYLSEGNLWSWTEASGNVLLAGAGDMTAVRLFEDGQLLAFMRGREVWTIRMDGTDARPLVVEEEAGGALRFAPDGSLLAVSTADHIDVIDLTAGTTTTVVIYPAIPNGFYPEVVWSADGTGFKTVIPPASEKGQAEFLFVMIQGTKASLAKFSTVPLAENRAFISPDGGYVIYVATLSDGKESLYLMDSSGATKPFGEPATAVRALGWLPDSRHFSYTSEDQDRMLIGAVTGDSFVKTNAFGFENISWLGAERFLGVQDNILYLGDINGEKGAIAEKVTDFDFAK